MNVTTILNETITSVKGAQFAGIVGTDGLGVAMAYHPDAAELDLDIELAELELAELASRATAAAARIGAGFVRDLVIETDVLLMLAIQIMPGYYGVLGVLNEMANLGKARFALQAMVERLRTEL
jgi:predicted regulator of Ras-like GTPase activity (Roadblock/LC7/MglB family)